MTMSKMPLLLPAPKKFLSPLHVISAGIWKGMPIMSRIIIGVCMLLLIMGSMKMNCIDYSKPILFENILSFNCETQSGMIKTNNEEKVLGANSSATLKTANLGEIQKWEQIVKQYPLYRDGWIALSYEYYKSGNIQSARDALNVAINLDPVRPIIDDVLFSYADQLNKHMSIQ